jgi:hypothetical protein
MAGPVNAALLGLFHKRQTIMVFPFFRFPGGL